jgi:predicted kinase
MVNLILLCGYTGVGKTTIARLIVKKKGYIHIRGSDVAREMKAPPDLWPYEFRKRKYERMFEKAKFWLKKGKSVILDAVFDLQEFRNNAKRVAEETGARFILVEVVCDENIVKRRIEERYKINPDSPHLEIHEIRRKEFEPIKEPHYTIDNSGNLNELEDKIEKIISKLD